MLIDLEWKEHQHPTYTLERAGNDTIVHMDFEGERHSLLVARRVDRGIYMSRTLDNMLGEITEWEEDRGYPGHPYFHFGGLDFLHGTPRQDVDFGILCNAMNNSPSSYGVADNLDQVRAYAPDYWTSERTFILTFYTVTREEDPGWRWHKNGQYIGTQEPQAEHLGDEPDIEQVISWGFIEVKPNSED